jgi:hypothetical protein
VRVGSSDCGHKLERTVVWGVIRRVWLGEVCEPWLLFPWVSDRRGHECREGGVHTEEGDVRVQ